MANTKRLEPRKCIFCGGNKVTGEHLWPDWARDLFDPIDPREPYGASELQLREGVRGDVRKVRNRQGRITGKKIPAPCGTCNSGWMSDLETATKPILIPVVAGQNLTLSPNEQLVLTQWLTLKFMVAEHNERNQAVFTQDQRDRFYADRTIPSDFKVWIFRCGKPPWRTTYYPSVTRTQLVRNSHLPDIADLASGPNNVQTIAFGFNELFVYATLTVGSDFELNIDPGPGAYLLWPPSGLLIKWPPDITITVQHAEKLATAFRTFARSGGRVRRV